MNIELNISQEFHNKDIVSGRGERAYGDSFHPTTLTPAELVTHATAGKAWTLHKFTGNRRKGDLWESSQLLALDLDDYHETTAQLTQNSDISAYAYLIYPTPSDTPKQPKNRVVFILDTAITNPDDWQHLQRGIMHHFANLKPDEKCKDLARLFYGSDKRGAITVENILPIAGQPR